MKVIHLASFDRWTGAAAIAFVEAAALRSAGVGAGFAYVGGYLLEEKIGHLDWTHPIILPGRSPVSTLRSARAMRRLIDLESPDVVHAHLSHDHWLARFALSGRDRTRLVRTFHAGRALRNDPLTKWLIVSTDACAVVNPALADEAAIAGTRVSVTPPPIEPQYVPDGPSARSIYGIPEEVPVIGYIGKVSPGRGFEDAIEAFGIFRNQFREARMLIVGHGRHRAELEHLVLRLGLTDAVIWAGYHEDDLADHFRAMDLMFFAAAGSDQGHRAIIEANGCGTPAVSYPIAGVPYIIGGDAAELITRESIPEALAKVALDLFPNRVAALRARVAENAARFTYGISAHRLIEIYESVLRR